MLNLLASRGLFAGLIVMVAVVVLLCIGLAVWLLIKPLKSKEVLEADAVRKELYRRETELVIKIITEKAEGKAKEELIGELRRVKSAQALVDGIIKAEKAERGIVDKPRGGAKPRSGNEQARTNEQPDKPAATAVKDAEKAEAAAASDKKAPAAQAPVKKENDGQEVKPSEK